MYNKELNLIPLNERSEEERRKITSKGGRASAVVRKQKKTARELVRMCLNMPLSEEQQALNGNSLISMGFKKSEITQLALAVVAVVKRVQETGDARALQTLLDVAHFEDLDAQSNAAPGQNMQNYNFKDFSMEELVTLERLLEKANVSSTTESKKGARL
jgi:hypothetical protein